MVTTQAHDCLSGHEFFLYLDGSASSPSKVRIEKHLNICNPCFEVFISLFNDFLNEATPQDWAIGASTAEQVYA